jgi:Xaa-Pro aminopeptidase
MNLKAIQEALREMNLDGWLFCDHHHRDAMAYRILGLDMRGITSRRWFYFVPAEGAPRKLAHKVEPRKLDSLPGEPGLFLSWSELHEELRGILGSPKKIAMQYSPLNDIPYVGLVDAGTVELVRSFGHEVHSSAELVQRFEAVLDDAGLQSHRWAGERVQRIKDEAFERMRSSLRDGTRLTENDVKEFILGRFEEEGMTSDGESPIVGFNDHPSDPHFEPTADNAYVLEKGTKVLLDLWARRKEKGVYYDITWCAFAGSEPPKKYLEIFDVVRRARDAAVDLVRTRFEDGAAVAGWEVDDACRGVVRDAGYGEFFVHRTGHSIGTSVHGNGANIDNLETRDTRPLVRGLCFSIEPGIYLDGEMAVRTEVDVFITPGGQVEVFGPVQQELVLLA